MAFTAAGFHDDHHETPDEFRDRDLLLTKLILRRLRWRAIREFGQDVHCRNDSNYMVIAINDG